MRVISFRVSDEEEARFTALQRRIEEEEGKYPEVTQRLVVLRAIEKLEAYYERLDERRKKD